MNIIQIVSDTLRRDFLGCYGNSWVRTKYINTFAKDCVVFDRAYISSFPTIPHRHDLFTGRYTFTYSTWSPLPTNEVILSQTLRQAGYTTMLIGDTYHLFRDAHYFDRGFDGWLWIRGQESDRYITRPARDTLERQKAVGTQYLQNVANRRWESDFFVAQTMTEAVKWLESNYDQHEKFFLHIDTFDPHEPWDPPKWYADMYDPDWKGGEVSGGAYVPGEPMYRRSAPLTDDELKHLRALYAGEVTLVDRWVGLLLQKIEDLGLFEDTAVIFTTDHGTYQGEHGYLRKSTHLYEEVAHIPLMIRLPDSEGVKSGRCDALVQPTDLMPTILQLADARIPNTVQGKSLLPLLRGEDYREREITVSSASLIVPETIRMTITSKDWSLITVKNDAPFVDKLGVRAEPELYYLSKDPGQQNNIYQENREIAEKLHEKMIHFLESIGTKEEIVDRWRRPTNT